MTRTAALTLRLKTAWSSLLNSGLRGMGLWIREASTGSWQRNEDINVATVFTNPTLYACITEIAGDIAKLRPMLVEQDTNRIWSEVDSPVFSPFLRKPNDFQDPFSFYEWWILTKLSYGAAFALKERDNRGGPNQGVVRAAYLVDPNRTFPLVAPDGSVFYQLAPDPLAGLEESVVVPAREMFHDVMCPLFHPLCGVSPIYAAGYPATQGLTIRRSSDKFFANGSRPGGVLLVPGEISQTQANQLKTDWETGFSGDNVGKIAILSGNMKYEPMAQTAEQSRLIEQLHMSDEDICKCFHMPRHKVGVGPDPTYNNAGVLNQQYYSDCLQKLLTKLQQVLTRGVEVDRVVGRTLAIEFDLDDLQLMDSAQRIEAGVKAITGGMSPNEARFRFFDLGPVENGDQPFLQKQNWPLSMLGTDQPAIPEPTPTPDAAPEPAEPETQLASWKRETLDLELRLKQAAA